MEEELIREGSNVQNASFFHTDDRTSKNGALILLCYVLLQLINVATFKRIRRIHQLVGQTRAKMEEQRRIHFNHRGNE